MTNMLILVAALLAGSNITLTVSNAPMDREAFIQQYVITYAAAGQDGWARDVDAWIQRADDAYTKIHSRFHVFSSQPDKPDKPETTALRRERKRLETLRQQPVEK